MFCKVSTTRFSTSNSASPLLLAPLLASSSDVRPCFLTETLDNLLAAGCIMQYWRTLDQTLPVKCPLDRSPISFLAPNHALRALVVADQGGQDENANTLAQDETQLATYNELFAHLPRSIPQELREDIAMYRNLNPSRGQWWLIHGLMILVILYVIFPFDLIPDYLGLVGLLDDAFALVFVLAVVVMMFNGIREGLINDGVRR